MSLTIFIVRMQHRMTFTIEVYGDKAIFFTHSEIEGRGSLDQFPVNQQFCETMKDYNVGRKHLHPVSIETMIADIDKS